MLYYETTALLKVKGISFNKFSSDLQFDSRIPIEDFETKDNLKVFVVGNLVCVAELKLPVPKSKSNYAMFFNLKGELVKKIEVDAEYNIESIKLTWDENNIIINACNRVPNPNKKLDNNYYYKVFVYDKNLDKIAEESFMFEDIFTNSGEISTLTFDYSSNKQIIALCSKKKKLKKAQLNMAVFNKTGEKPVLYNYNFTNEYVNYEICFGKQNRRSISIP